MPALNPFLYGKPIPPNRFIDREDEIQTLFSRIYNGESSALVGEPHVGKSSVFAYIADEEVRRKWLGDKFEKYILVDIDCQLFPADCKPPDLWSQIIAGIKERGIDDAIRQQSDIVIQNDFGSFALEGLFRLLGRKGWHIILLMDEFDTLLNHPKFNTAEFFGGLRSFSTRTDALVMVSASRLSVAHMNRKSQETNPFGSPFFNNVIEIRLLPFSPHYGQKLIETTLQNAGSKISFSPDDCAFLFSLAGRQPFLLQVASACLFDALAKGKRGEDCYQDTTKVFYERAAAHFEDFWRHLNATEQRAMFLLALSEYRGFVDGRAFDMRELGKLERYAPDLRHLRDLGVVESESGKGSIIWAGENWRVASAGIVAWLMDNIAAGIRDTQDFDAVRGMEFLGPLTREEIIKLQEVAAKIPRGAVGMAIGFINSLLKR